MDIDLTNHELGILIYVTKNRLKNEAKRRRRLNKQGQDIQALRVRQLADILDKLQETQTKL